MGVAHHHRCKQRQQHRSYGTQRHQTRHPEFTQIVEEPLHAAARATWKPAFSASLNDKVPNDLFPLIDKGKMRADLYRKVNVSAFFAE